MSIRTLQFDAKAQEHVGALLSLASVMLVNTPVKMGPVSVIVLPNDAMLTVSAAIAILCNANTSEEFEAVTNEQFRACMNKAYELLANLTVSLLEDSVNAGL